MFVIIMITVLATLNDPKGRISVYLWCWLTYFVIVNCHRGHLKWSRFFRVICVDNILLCLQATLDLNPWILL